jgi:hypothetical protein
MMEFESTGSNAPGTNENDTAISHKRNCELLEDAETKKSKLDTSCDETIGSTVASSSPKNPVS